MKEDPRPGEELLATHAAAVEMRRGEVCKYLTAKARLRMTARARARMRKSTQASGNAATETQRGAAELRARADEYARRMSKVESEVWRYVLEVRAEAAAQERGAAVTAG